MQNNLRSGILLMILTMFVFASQDGISRHLASTYNVEMVVMVRYWFFAAFVLWLATRTEGGIKAVARSTVVGLQILRGVILAVEIWIAILGFTYLGLIASHAIFACYPLMIAALSGPILGEKVGWRRWIAIGIGFVGLLIVLQPGAGVFSIAAALPFISALLFAVYGLLNRYVARTDRTSTSFFWTGTVGAVLATFVGIWSWENMTPNDWLWMGTLCVSGALGHWLLIKCYELAEASVLQPFAYFHLVFVTLIGIAVFGETLSFHIALGSAVVIGAGLFTLWRERLKTSPLKEL